MDVYESVDVGVELRVMYELREEVAVLETRADADTLAVVVDVFDVLCDRVSVFDISPEFVMNGEFDVETDTVEVLDVELEPEYVAVPLEVFDIRPEFVGEAVIRDDRVFTFVRVNEAD